MKVKDAQRYGKVSKGNTKMPGTTYAIDAFACGVGSKLAEIEGTPCEQCYARKLQRLRPSVDQGWKLNLEKWEQRDSTNQWVFAIAMQIMRWSDGYHRWFDSGDLQSYDMLLAIVDVALMTPTIKHWLPTQERAILNRFYEEGNVLPDNLVIRVSSAKVDVPITGWDNQSYVFKDTAPQGKECRARHNGNACGDCRACWSKDVPLIAYPKH
jgi:hypothetical protein